MARSHSQIHHACPFYPISQSVTTSAPKLPGTHQSSNQKLGFPANKTLSSRPSALPHPLCSSSPAGGIEFGIVPSSGRVIVEISTRIHEITDSFGRQISFPLADYVSANIEPLRIKLGVRDPGWPFFYTIQTRSLGSFIRVRRCAESIANLMPRSSVAARGGSAESTSCLRVGDEQPGWSYLPG